MSMNATSVKFVNRSRVLNLIRRRTNLSRQEIAEAIGLSAPAVGKIVAELIEEGLVRESGRRQHQRGQPPIELELCAGGAYALGLFLDANEVSGALIDLGGELLAQEQISRQALLAPAEALELLTGLAARLVTRQHRDRLVGIGLAAFGPLDLEAGTVNAPQHSEAWVDVPLRDRLAEATGYTVYLDNDATAAAIGEHWYGAGQRYQNYLYLHLVTDGLGGGLFLNGTAYRGGTLNAAEFGHMLIRHDGRLRFLEEIVSIKALARLSGGDGGAGGPLEAVERRFEGGDPRLLAALDDAAAALAECLVSADHLLDLDAIILGGQASEPLLQHLLDTARRHSEPLFMKGRPGRPVLMLGQSGRHSAVLGAASIPLYDAFVLPSRIGTPEQVFPSDLEVSA